MHFSVFKRDEHVKSVLKTERAAVEQESSWWQLQEALQQALQIEH